MRWSWQHLALSRRSTIEPNWWCQVFALRCGLCHRLTWGCREHWFCGLCEPCRVKCEEE